MLDRSVCGRSSGRRLARAGRAARLHITAAACTIALSFALPPAHALDASGLPTLYTNERFIDDVTRATKLDLGDVKSVFAYVLGELPPRVRVFPTENYYYFYFYQGGIKYAGNFRFDVDQRDKGLVEFVYFKDTTDWIEDDEDHHATLGANDGVIVKKVANLVYEVSFGERTVTFELNDLSAARPPAGTLAPGEVFLGPVADESGIRFFLTFDETLKVFHYVLDETVPVADELLRARGFDHLSLGRRTGFAFFDDVARSRRLLVGVYAGNVAVNNYMDGPFDQLPDNFLKGDELRQAILAAYPDIDEPIDRLGISPDGETRRLIAPYMEYEGLEELARAEACAAEKDDAALYRCLDALAQE